MAFGMLKLTFYFILFYIVGYSYGVITNGTVFDHIVIRIIILFFFIFIVECIFSFIKKKRQTHEEQVANEGETWNEIIEDVGKQFEKTWCINYKDNEIKIVNRYNHEQLYINDQLVAEKRRNRWYSWMKPYQLLTGVMDENGQSLKVKVKLGGIININCRVFVDKELIFKEKIKFNLFSSGVKKSD